MLHSGIFTKRQLPVQSTRSDFASVAKKMKKAKKDSDLTIQKEAYGALLKAKAANGGELKYGMVESCAQTFEKQGFGDLVTARMLHYCLGLEKRGLSAFDDEEEAALIASLSVVDEVGMSPLTQPDSPTNKSMVGSVSATKKEIVVSHDGDSVDSVCGSEETPALVQIVADQREARRLQCCNS
jgi:hypothetical protein